MALSKLSKQRLLTLILFLEGLPKEARKHFNMRWWVAHNGEGENIIGQHGIKTGREVTKEKLLVECGLAACAMGWAAMIPSFKKAGLHLVPYRRDNAVLLAPSYKGENNVEAAMKFFDLDQERTDDLFGPELPVKTPAQWAARARRKLAKWEL